MLVIIDESAKEVVKIDREEKLKELMDGYQQSSSSAYATD